MNHMNETPVDVKRSFALKVARGMFQPIARHLRQDIAEDRLAEGIAMTFELYAKNAAEGRVIPDAVLVQACHMRAIDLSRRVAGSQGGQPKRDAYDPRNYTDGKLGSSAWTPAARIWRGSPAWASTSPARRTPRAGWRQRWTSSAGSGHSMARTGSRWRSGRPARPSTRLARRAARASTGRATGFAARIRAGERAGVEPYVAA